MQIRIQLVWFKGDLSVSCWQKSMHHQVYTTTAHPAWISRCRCQLSPTVVPTLTYSTGFYRKLQMKIQYCSVTIVAHDYSVFAQANAYLASWTQKAPEAFNRIGKLEILYFLPFVARTAVALKSRGSRFPRSTEKQSLTVKCPNICHYSGTNLVCV